MAKKRSVGNSQRNRKQANAPVKSGACSWKDLAGMASICIATLIAYLPSIHGRLLWDDAGHVTAPALQSLHGLWRIWSELGATQQYYPLLHSAFWLQHRLWGDAVVGYHLTNILFHGLAACLVVQVVRRLRLPGAWLAGFIFALHPVCVESVAWISEQKSTLSAVFYLAAALEYLRFDETRRKSRYFVAAGFFVLALLSKTVTATLPAALLLVLWWRHGRIGVKRNFLPLLPWLVLGVAAGLFTAWVESAYIGAHGDDFSLTFLQRVLLAGRAVWFYLSKTVWPSHLTFMYPRFHLDATAWWQYLFPAAVVALAVYLWMPGSRRRGLLAGWLFFVGTLFPVLGFLDVYPFRYSFVADHFQYLACLGILVPAACALALASGRVRESDAAPAFRPSFEKKPLVTAAACGIVLAVLFVLTWRQSGMYTDAETLWRATIARNPGSWMAYNNLSEILFSQERVDEAFPVSRTAVNLKPDDAEANANFANVLRYKNQLDEAIVYYKKAVVLKPDVASFHGSLANTLVEMGKIKEAITHFEKSYQLDPSDGLLMNNLAWILATCPEDSVRNGTRAVKLASRAIETLGSQDPTVLGTLAAAYAEAGRLKEAVATEEKALALARSGGNADLMEWHSQLLETYRVGQPHRESTLTPR